MAYKATDSIAATIYQFGASRRTRRIISVTFSTDASRVGLAYPYIGWLGESIMWCQAKKSHQIRQSGLLESGVPPLL